MTYGPCGSLFELQKKLVLQEGASLRAAIHTFYCPFVCAGFDYGLHHHGEGGRPFPLATTEPRTARTARNEHSESCQNSADREDSIPKMTFSEAIPGSQQGSLQRTPCVRTGSHRE